MSPKMLHVATCAVLLTGVLGAPFASEEEANQFLRLKRQTPYSHSYWDPSSSQNGWGHTVAEQASKCWTALRRTAQYCMDLGYLTLDANAVRDHIRSYLDMLGQSEAHLHEQTSGQN